MLTINADRNACFRTICKSAFIKYSQYFHRARALRISRIVLVIVVLLSLSVGASGGYIISSVYYSLVPGEVDGLSRQSLILTVHGWYKDTDITYLDFGSSIATATPMLTFFFANAPTRPVDGQRNVIDTTPGMPGYSDFWRVYKIHVPINYVVNSIRSFEQAVSSGYSIETTDLIVNCPVVNPNATIQGQYTPLIHGWFRGKDVFYFDLGTNSHAQGFDLDNASMYVFYYGIKVSDGHTEPGIQIANQRNVLDLRPGDQGYGALWNIVNVIVPPSYVANSLKDAGDILAAAAANQIRLETTSEYVNCPVVS